MAKHSVKCHNAKCGKTLDGNFIIINVGGLEQKGDCSVVSDNVEAFFEVNTHSIGDGPFGNVDLFGKFQHDYFSQAESYFCSKQCLIDWFTRKLKDLPEPGSETYDGAENG